MSIAYDGRCVCSAGSNSDGRLEVFGVGVGDALWHIWQTAPDGGWSDWGTLSGILVGEPAVVSNADGRLEVFARGTDNGLWHIWQTAPDGGWSGWESLGGIITSAPCPSNDAD